MRRPRSARTPARRAVRGSVPALAVLLVGCGTGAGGHDPSMPVTPVPVTSSGVPAPRSPAADPTPAPAYLSDLREVPSFHGNEFTRGEVGVMGGTSHPRSLRTRFCRDLRQAVMYNLRQPFSELIATVGLDDRSDPAAVVQLTILADDRVVYDAELRPGQAVPVAVPVRGAALVTLTATLRAERPRCSAVAVWGGARLQP